MKIAVVFLLVVLFLPLNAYAYVGPGLGLGAVGAVVGVLFSIVLAIIGIFWYPIKRLLRLGKKKKADKDDE